LDFAFGNFSAPNALEVKYESDIDWKDKKFSGVKLILKRYPKTKKVSIISKDKTATFKEGKINIEVLPAWRHLL
jgi:hypothetical protein